MKINIEKFQLLEICNIKFKAYYPIDKFVSYDEFINIIKLYNYKNKFFPLPIYFNINSKIFKNKSKNPINIYYNNIKVCTFKNYLKYKITNKTKLDLCKSLFGTKKKTHPGVNKFLKENQYYISSKIYEFNKEIISLIEFSKPNTIIRLLNKNNIKRIAGFHTRNAPHKGHEWIHNYALKKCGSLLIQPLVGMYKKDEYKEDVIIKSNLNLIENAYKKNKVFFSILNSYPRYCGPREAIFHAIIRKNYGCTHFMVGRDHAGIKNYYGKYESQKLCKKHEKKIGIKILTFDEPKFCSNCKKVSNKLCNFCKKSKMKSISGTYVRKLLLNNKKIPEHIMRYEVSSILNKNSLIT